MNLLYCNKFNSLNYEKYFSTAKNWCIKVILITKGIMRIIELYKNHSPVFSVEVFPPKTVEGMNKLKIRLEKFKEFNPDYISVTYGAGGGTRANTQKISSFIKNNLNIEVLAHLTCVCHTKKEINEMLNEFIADNIENIMALRGDFPKERDSNNKCETRFSYAVELISAIVKLNKFGIGAAGYPEGHIEAESLEKDEFYLLEKINRGAEFIVSQFFMDNSFFLRWRDSLISKGVKVPLVPGILPAQSVEQITRFAKMCGCKIPDCLLEKLIKYENDPNEMRKVGLDYATKQVENLLTEGIPGIHLYALNNIEVLKYIAPIIKN